MMLKKAEGRVKNEETGRKPPVTRMLHLQAKAVSPLRSATAVQNAGGLATYNRAHRGVRVNQGKSNRIKVNQGAFYLCGPDWQALRVRSNHQFPWFPTLSHRFTCFHMNSHHFLKKL